MEKYTDLEKLKYALFIYRLCFWLIIPRIWNNVNAGFCYFFIEEFGGYWGDIPNSLIILRPYTRYPIGNGYWFKPGRLSSRIELLKKAIQIEIDNL